MRRCSRLTRQLRMRLLLAVVLSLLVQQTALAAYICVPASMSVPGMAISAHCHGMPMLQGTAEQGAAAALCGQHCSHPTQASQDARLPSVPLVLLQAALPAQLPTLVLRVSRVAHACIAARRTAGIAPPLQHRVLLI